MAIDYKISKIEKVLDKDDVLLHYFVQAEFFDDNHRLSYDTKIESSKDLDLSKEVEKWLSATKVLFEGSPVITTSPVVSDNKRIKISENTVTLDKQKILTATAESVEAAADVIADEEIKP